MVRKGQGNAGNAQEMVQNGPINLSTFSWSTVDTRPDQDFNHADLILELALLFFMMASLMMVINGMMVSSPESIG